MCSRWHRCGFSQTQRRPGSQLVRMVRMNLRWNAENHERKQYASLCKICSWKGSNFYAWLRIWIRAFFGRNRSNSTYSRTILIKYGEKKLTLGSIVIKYHHHEDPIRSISSWISPISNKIRSIFTWIWSISTWLRSIFNHIRSIFNRIRNSCFTVTIYRWNRKYYQRKNFILFRKKCSNYKSR